MTRSRVVVFASLVVVAVGAVAAVGALYLDPARAAVGPLPGEALVLPADSRFVMGFDVRRFVDSPFYRRFADQHGQARPDAFAQLEEKTGLNPERDVDRIVVAGREAGRRDAGVVLVNGRFDRYKLGHAIEEKPGVTSKNHQGTALYLFKEGTKGASAVAFLDDDTLVLGSQAGVEAVVENRLNGNSGLRANASLMALLRTVKPGATFWMVGDQSVLSQMPRGIPAPGAEGSTVQLPALRSVVVTGDLEPMVALDVTGEAADAASAQNLADVVRGLVALASLQAQQKPELKALASAVSVTTEANRVHVSARLPYELLDSLQPKRRSVAASAAPE